MTQEQKRIKLAEAAGWKLCREDNKTWRTPQQAAKNKELLGHESGPWSFESSGPPDYFSDLNAVHELEKVLLGDDIETWLTYDKYLAEGDTKFTWHVTAAQRAEALGLTLNLW
jgi:hypothetical protein